MKNILWTFLIRINKKKKLGWNRHIKRDYNPLISKNEWLNAKWGEKICSVCI